MPFDARKQNWKKRRPLAWSYLSVCPSARNNSSLNGQISMKFYIWVFFESLLRKFKVHENLTRITGTLHKHRHTFVIVPRSFLLRMRNFSDKCCREIQNTHFMFSNFFRKSLLLWGNVEKPCTTRETTDNNKLWGMRVAWWISKATNICAEYVILITFPRQEWLRQGALMLCYTCTACLVLETRKSSHLYRQLFSIQRLATEETFTRVRLIWPAILCLIKFKPRTSTTVVNSSLRGTQ